PDEAIVLHDNPDSVAVGGATRGNRVHAASSERALARLRLDHARGEQPRLAARLDRVPALHSGRQRSRTARPRALRGTTARCRDPSAMAAMRPVALPVQATMEGARSVRGRGSTSAGRAQGARLPRMAARTGEGQPAGSDRLTVVSALRYSIQYT